MTADLTRGPASRIPLGICTLCMLSCGLWAFWPSSRTGASPLMPEASAPSFGSRTPTQSLLTPVAQVDLSAFRTPLWVAPTPPPPAPAPPPPPPPLKLQLIAIAGDSDSPGGRSYVATVFDPETGNIHTVRPRASIGTKQVTRVTAHTVELKDGALVRTLSLQAESAGTRPSNSATEDPR